MVMDIGRVCLKIAGRDANRHCVIVEVLDAPFVLIDGQTRRRRCNVAHLQPLEQALEISKGASHAQVKAAMDKAGFAATGTTPKPKFERPRAGRIEKTLLEPQSVKEPAPKKAAKAALPTAKTAV